MTDNEIIKAFDGAVIPCGANVYLWNDKESKVVVIPLKKIADFINRQKAELENYSHNNRTMTKDIRKLQKALERAKAEIERFEDVNIRLTKAEAIKEFAEELKEQVEYLPRLELDGTNYFLVSKRFIDNLVKERVGDDGCLRR